MTDAPSRSRRITPARIARSLGARRRTLMWKAFERGKAGARRLSPAAPRGHVLVFGCQRSGTTLVERLFRADPRSAVFGEFSALSVDETRTLWRPLPQVAAHLSAQHAQYTLARSLYFSHRAAEAIEAMTPSAGLWIFREAGPVVRSMIQKWGADFRAISERVEGDRDGRWELRPLWDRIEAEARDVGDGTPERLTADSYALFWLHRNEAFFGEAERAGGRLLLVDYADVVRDPVALVTRALGLIEVAPPGWIYPLATREGSRHGSAMPSISPPIAQRCEALHARLMAARDRPGEERAVRERRRAL